MYSCCAVLNSTTLSYCSFSWLARSCSLSSLACLSAFNDSMLRFSVSIDGGPSPSRRLNPTKGEKGTGDLPRAANIGEGDLSVRTGKHPLPCKCGEKARWAGEM